jgi:malonyl-CoA O-methyltransferase
MSKEWFYLSPDLIKRSFNRAATTYNQFAELQRIVATRIIERLDLIRIQPKNILDIGAGTGFATSILADRYPEANVFPVDIAHSMLKELNTHKKGRSNIVSVNANALYLPFPTHSIDFIFSSFTLHWISDFNQLFSEWQRVLKPGGLVMFSILGVDTLKELRESFTMTDDYAHVHAFYDLHDVGDALLQHQFLDPVMDVEYFTLNFTDVYQLMRELKGIGGHNIAEARRSGLMGKSKLQTMMKHYEKFRDQNGRIPATYEVIYGHAWGTYTNKKGEVQIPLSAIKRNGL